MDEKQILKYMVEKRYIEGEYICWDFVMDIYRDLYNIELPEYPVGEVQAEFKNKLISNFNHVIVKGDGVGEGDIVVFSAFAAQHAGVMINEKDFIHLAREGVRVANFSTLIGSYKIYRIVK